MIAVSTDPLVKQQKFKAWAGAEYRFIADTEKRLVTIYDVKGWLGVKRQTFVIGQDGVVKEVITGLRAIDPSASLEALA